MAKAVRNKKRSVMKAFSQKLEMAAAMENREAQWKLVRGDVVGMRAIVKTIERGVRDAQIQTGKPLFYFKPYQEWYGPVALRELSELMVWMGRRSIALYGALGATEQVKSADEPSRIQTQAFFELRKGDLYRYMADVPGKSPKCHQKTRFYKLAIHHYKLACKGSPVASSQGISRIMHEMDIPDLELLFKLRAVALDKILGSQSGEEARAAIEAADNLRTLLMKKYNTPDTEEPSSPFDRFLGILISLVCDNRKAKAEEQRIALFKNGMKNYKGQKINKYGKTQLLDSPQDQINEGEQNQNGENNEIENNAFENYWGCFIAAFAVLAAHTMESSVWEYCHGVFNANPELKQNARWLHEFVQRPGRLPRERRGDWIPMIVYAIQNLNFDQLYWAVQQSPNPTT